MADAMGISDFVLSGFAGLVGGACTLVVQQLLDRATHGNTQFRLLVDEIDEAVETATAKAVQYWNGSATSSADGRVIVQSIKDIASLVELLIEWYPPGEEQLRQSLRDFNRATTGADFLALEVVADITRASEVGSSGTELRIALKRVRRRHNKIF